MSDSDTDSLIFNRYTREECGLPPRGKEGWRGAVTFWRVAAVFILTAAAAWLGGEAMARWREQWVSQLPSRVASAQAEEIPELLEQGRIFAAALPKNQRMRRDLAISVLTASERMPRRLGYYGTAAGLFRGLSTDGMKSGRERFVTELMAAGTYAEVREYQDAFSALDRAEKALDDISEEERRAYRLLLVNAQSYFLASAEGHDGGNPVKAAELARLVVSSRDPLPDGGFASGSAAFLDTFAVAQGRSGDVQGAAATQRMALGMAGGLGLDVYVRHYDEFNEGVHRTE